MRGRTHLALTAAVTGAILYALFDLRPLSFALLPYAFAGALLGSLLPDTDAEDATIYRRKLGGGYVLKLIGMATKWLAYKPVALIGKLLGRRWEGHRRLLHSLAGAFLAAFFWLAIGITALSALQAGKLQEAWLAFCGGLLGGFLLHVWEDSLTVSGVSWTSWLPASGRIRTGYAGWRFWRREELALAVALIVSAGSVVVTLKAGGQDGLLAALVFLPLSWLLWGKASKSRNSGLWLEDVERAENAMEDAFHSNVETEGRVEEVRQRAKEKDGLWLEE